jgi:hypothetical protein
MPARIPREEEPMDTTAATAALDELAHAVPVLGQAEVARRARAILDRAELAELDLVEFLKSKGYEGYFLFQAAADFGKALAGEYRRERGKAPIKAERFVEHLGQTRSVNLYLELDRELVENAFTRWSK